MKKLVSGILVLALLVCLPGMGVAVEEMQMSDSDADEVVWRDEENDWSEEDNVPYEDEVQDEGELQISALAEQTESAKNVMTAAGHKASYVLKADGTVWSFGDNTYGQLGDGTNQSRSEPRPIPGLTGVVKIAAAWNHAYAIKSDGTLWAWGQNNYAQIGDGTRTNRNIPTLVSNLAGVRIKEVAANRRHNLAIAEDGTVYAWGDNTAGQLGDGTTEGSLRPIEATEIGKSKSVAGSFRTTYTVQEDGTVWTRSYGGNQQMEGLTSFAYVLATEGQQGGDMAVGIRENGEVWLLDGPSSLGQLPMQVPGISDVVQADIGDSHVIARKSDGTIWGFGTNSYGQLGIGSYNQLIMTPVQMNHQFTAVWAGAGMSLSLIVKDDGKVSACGLNDVGQQGEKPDVHILTETDIFGPINVTWETPITVVPTESAKNVMTAAGHKASYVLKADGTVWSFGDNTYGQLGDGTTYSRSEPRPIPGLTDVVKIAAAWNHAYAIKSDGTLWAWGQNNYAQIGDGTKLDRCRPTLVSNLDGVKIKEVAANRRHNLAIAEDGTVYAWGDNTAGQLGDGTTEGSLRPIEATEIGKSKSVAGSFRTTYTVQEDGTVWTRSYGGNQQMEGLTSFAYVLATEEQQNNRSMAVGIRENGEVWLLAGSYDSGQLPMQVPGIGDVVQADIGDSHVIARKSDGTVWGLGTNSYGQLGIGSYNQMIMTPVQMHHQFTAVWVGAGASLSLIAKDDGTVSACGLNDAGQQGEKPDVHILTETNIFGPINEILEDIMTQPKFFLGFSGETEILSMQSGFVRTRFEVINDTTAAMPVMAIVMLNQISTNTMIDVAIVERNISANSREAISAGFNVPQSSDYEIRIELWDDRVGMNRLCAPYTFR